MDGKLEIEVFIPYASSRAARQAIRSLMKSGFTVIRGEITSQQRKTEQQADVKDHCIEHPCPYKNNSEFSDWLDGWMRSNRHSLVFPIDEAVIHAAIPLLSRSIYREQLVSPSVCSLSVALSKFNATKMAIETGLSVPRTYFIRKPGTLEICLPKDNILFPLLLKWDNAESPEGQYQKGGNAIVESRRDLEAYCAELEMYRCGIILQELVPGKGVGAFFLRHKGQIVLSFAHRRLHEVPWTGGVSAYCESSDDAEVLEAGRRLLDSIDYEGVAMVEFRKSPSKPPMFLEINGRLWGSLGLALSAGADFPRAMIECHLYGKTEVKQPNLSQRVRWHDPGLELDHLRSLWRVGSDGAKSVTVSRARACLQVLANYLNPRVKSDWLDWSDLRGSITRYRRWARREVAWLKSVLLQPQRNFNTNTLVKEAIARTQHWRALPGKPRSILFVCYGNICRSPYAEYRWNCLRQETLDLPTATSTGFHYTSGRKTPSRFQSLARYLGVDLQNHQSKRLVEAELMTSEVIFAMDARNLCDLLQAYPETEPRLFLLGALGAETPEIPDPYDQPIGAGVAVYKRIDRELLLLRSLLIGET